MVSEIKSFYLYIDDWSNREGFEYEHVCWDPKDGELYLGNAKSGETLIEARSDTDVQIVGHTWA